MKRYVHADVDGQSIVMHLISFQIKLEGQKQLEYMEKLRIETEKLVNEQKLETELKLKQLEQKSENYKTKEQTKAMIEIAKVKIDACKSLECQRMDAIRDAEQRREQLVLKVLERGDATESVISIMDMIFLNASAYSSEACYQAICTIKADLDQMQFQGRGNISDKDICNSDNDSEAQNENLSETSD